MQEGCEPTEIMDHKYPEKEYHPFVWCIIIFIILYILQSQGVWKFEDFCTFLLPFVFSKVALRRLAASFVPGPLHFPPHFLDIPLKNGSLMQGSSPNFNSLHTLQIQSIYLLMLVVASCHYQR